MKNPLVFLSITTLLFGGTIVFELEEILKNTAPSDMIPIIIQTKEQGDLSLLPSTATYDEKIGYLKFVAEKSQKDILAYLKKVGAEEIKSFFLVSRIAAKTTPEVIRELGKRKDIDFITDDFVVSIDSFNPSTEPTDATDTPEWNIVKVRADSCWRAGWTGEGIVVSNIDTGVDVFHPAFGGRWRQTNGWFDAVNRQTNPYDDNGHGTHTMGIITGGDGLGPFPNDIGIAPGATIIAAKGFNAQGAAQLSWLDACFNWLADTGRPNIISNSWGVGNRTDTYFWNTCVNLRNLGIITVFSIGSSGPGSGTSCPPGSYPVVIGAGATDSSDNIASFSARGPAPNQSSWNDTTFWPRSDWNLINPSISAPGVNIRSSYPGGNYTVYNGTSMSCPHIAGCVALMLQKRSGLTPIEVFNLITDNADRPPRGEPYPNNTYGWGRLNCKKVLDAIPTSVEESKPLLSSVSKVHCYPNPFKKFLTIKWQLRNSSEVRVSIHDCAGRIITSLWKGRQSPGIYHLLWEEKSSGIYFVNIRTSYENLWYKVSKF